MSTGQTSSTQARNDYDPKQQVEIIELVIRNAILFNIKEDTSLRPDKLRPYYVNAVNQAITYRLITDGFFTPEELGIKKFDGCYPARFVQEMHVLRAIFISAENDKRKKK